MPSSSYLYLAVKKFDELLITWAISIPIVKDSLHNQRVLMRGYKYSINFIG